MDCLFHFTLHSHVPIDSFFFLSSCKNHVQTNIGILLMCEKLLHIDITRHNDPQFALQVNGNELPFSSYEYGQGPLHQIVQMIFFVGEETANITKEHGSD